MGGVDCAFWMLAAKQKEMAGNFSMLWSWVVERYRYVRFRGYDRQIYLHGKLQLSCNLTMCIPVICVGQGGELQR